MQQNIKARCESEHTLTRTRSWEVIVSAHKGMRREATSTRPSLCIYRVFRACGAVGRCRRVPFKSVCQPACLPQPHSLAPFYHNVQRRLQQSVNCSFHVVPVLNTSQARTASSQSRRCTRYVLFVLLPMLLAQRATGQPRTALASSPSLRRLPECVKRCIH
jgi:hypothetical protein